MIIGLHDSDKTNFPNYALMKLSAWHKMNGNKVEWFMPLMPYDEIYSSKVFTFTPEDPYLPSDAIRGGVGYGSLEALPEEIDEMFPDYSIYPKVDYAIGYLTRGCIRNCPWCIVPKKEGYIKPYRKWEDIVRPDSRDIVFMDNNVLASDFGIEQMESMIGKNVRVIEKNAFKGSKATKMIVKSKYLTKASVKGSLKGSKIKTVQVKVGKKKDNKKYVKKYKKIFTKKNAGKKVKVK